MYQLAEIKALASTGSIEKLILRDAGDGWTLLFTTSSIKNFALRTQRGKKRIFKTLDAAADVARELCELAGYEAGEEITVLIDF